MLDKLTNTGQFLTAPVSLIQGKKVELLDTCRSKAMKVALIALSTLCLVLTLGISHLVGLHFKKVKQLVPKLEEKNVLPQAGSEKSHQTVIPVELGLSPDQHAAVASAVVPILDPSRIQSETVEASVAIEPLIYLHSMGAPTIEDSSATIVDASHSGFCHSESALSEEFILEEWMKVIEECKSAPKSLEEIKGILAAKKIAYNKSDLEKILIYYLEEGDFDTVEVILKLKEKFVIDDLFKAMLASFEVCYPGSGKYILNYMRSVCCATILDYFEFTDEQYKELFIKACRCSASIDFIRKLIEVKKPDFFKKLVPQVIKNSPEDGSTGQINLMILKLGTLTNPSVTNAFGSSQERLLGTYVLKTVNLESKR
jgi:hypothetical protein